MLTSVVLPLVLAFIMFSLGISLTLGDFARVLTRPRASLVGAVCQMLFLPIVAFLLLQVFKLPPELQVGVMILSFVPGGVTSNMITRFGRGDVALSVTLTAVISLLFLLTLPILIPASVGYFQGAELAAAIPVASTVLSAFLIAVVPVAIGVLLREFFPGPMQAIQNVVSIVAAVLFVVVVLAAIATNWDILMANLPVLGPVLILLNLIMLAVGWFVARGAGLNGKSATTVAIEAGVQNALMGIVVGNLLWAALGDGTDPAFSTYALPAAAYGVTMYIVTAPFVFWRFMANRNAS